MTHLTETLEGLIDRYGLEAVLQTAAYVAMLKADHLRSNWAGDGPAQTDARMWEHVAKHLDKPIALAKDYGLSHNRALAERRPKGTK